MNDNKNEANILRRIGSNHGVNILNSVFFPKLPITIRSLFRDI